MVVPRRHPELRINPGMIFVMSACVQEFCLLIGERARLEEEVASHKQRILNMETQAAKDKTAIDEYKLQVLRAVFVRGVVPDIGRLSTENSSGLTAVHTTKYRHISGVGFIERSSLALQCPVTLCVLKVSDSNVVNQKSHASGT